MAAAFEIRINGETTRVDLGDLPTVVGRHGDCDLVLASEAVSRRLQRERPPSVRTIEQLDRPVGEQP